MLNNAFDFQQKDFTPTSVVGFSEQIALDCKHLTLRVDFYGIFISFEVKVRIYSS